MKEAVLIFLFKETINGFPSRKIKVNYQNFTDLSKKITTYLNNGIIVTTEREVNSYANLLSNPDKTTHIGWYIGKNDILDVLIEFINNNNE